MKVLCLGLKKCFWFRRSLFVSVKVLGLELEVFPNIQKTFEMQKRLAKVPKVFLIKKDFHPKLKVFSKNKKSSAKSNHFCNCRSPETLFKLFFVESGI